MQGGVQAVGAVAGLVALLPRLSLLRLPQVQLRTLLPLPTSQHTLQPREKPDYCPRRLLRRPQVLCKLRALLASTIWQLPTRARLAGAAADAAAVGVALWRAAAAAAQQPSKAAEVALALACGELRHSSHLHPHRHARAHLCSRRYLWLRAVPGATSSLLGLRPSLTRLRTRLAHGPPSRFTPRFMP